MLTAITLKSLPTVVPQTASLVLGASQHRLQGDFIASFQYLKGAFNKMGTDFLIGPVAIGQGVKF